MKIYHYDDEYAGKVGVNGVKEFTAALIIAVIGTIVPTVLMCINVINVVMFISIVIVAIIFFVYFIRKTGISNKASLSVLIESGENLYYMMISPNLRGSAFPKSIPSALAGPTVVSVENKIDAEIIASNIAQNDAMVTHLFNLYLEDKIKSNFDTLMYGKPVYVYQLLDKNFSNENRKIYRVKCIKNKKIKTTVLIPNAFPKFFNAVNN